MGIAVCRRHRQPYGEDCGDFSDAAMVASEQGYSMQNPVLFLMEPPVEQGEKDDERPKGRRAVGLIHTKQESYKGQRTQPVDRRRKQSKREKRWKLSSGHTHTHVRVYMYILPSSIVPGLRPSDISSAAEILFR